MIEQKNQIMVFSNAISLTANPTNPQQTDMRGWPLPGALMKPVKIPVSQLRPGMMVVAPNTSWINAPYIYGKSGVIKSADEIRHIIACGYTEAYYDPERSERPLNDPLHGAQQTSLAEELCHARDLYFDAFNYIKSLMQEKKVGAIEVARLRCFVNEIMQSLHRNFNALLLITTIKKTSDYTYRHSINVAIFAIAFSQFLGLDEEETFSTGMAGLFHDYGKAFVPQQVLNAPRALNQQETTIIRSHVIRGHDNLKELSWINSIILDGILHHHERHDGSGYPNRLAGEEIGLYGRIISICDVYDALASKRVYKDAIHPKHALGTLFKMSENAWAPGFAEHFIKMVGIFPIGTAVLLSNGQKGIVCHSDPLAPSLPRVLLVRDCEHGVKPLRMLDLSRQKTISVNRSLSKTETAYWDIPMLLDSANEEETV